MPYICNERNSRKSCSGIIKQKCNQKFFIIPVSSILLWLPSPVFLTHSSAFILIIQLHYGLQLIDSASLFNVWNLWVYSFHQIRKHFSLYFFKYSLNPKIPVICRWGHLMLSHSSLIFFLFLILFIYWHIVDL